MKKIVNVFLIFFSFIWTSAIATIFFLFVTKISGPFPVVVIPYIVTGVMFIIGLTICIRLIINLFKKQTVEQVNKPTDYSYEVTTNKTVNEPTPDMVNTSEFSEGSPINTNAPQGKWFLVFFTIVWNLIAWSAVIGIISVFFNQGFQAFFLLPLMFSLIFPAVGIFLIITTVKNFIKPKPEKVDPDKPLPIINNKCPYCGEELEDESVICLSCFKKVK